MAVAFGAVGPSSSGNVTLTWSHTAAAGSALIIGAVIDSAIAASTCTATYNSVTVPLLGSANIGNLGAGYLYVFGLANCGSGSAQTVTLTYTANGATAPDDTSCGSISFTGADLVAPFGTFQKSAGASSGTQTFGFTTTSSASLVCGINGEGGNNLTGMSAGTSRLLLNQGSSGAAGTIGIGTAPGTGSTVTLTWTGDTAADFSIAGVEVLPAGGTAAAASQQPVRPGQSRLWHHQGARRQQPYPTLPLNPNASPTAQTATASGQAFGPVSGTPYITGLHSGTGASYFVDQADKPRMWLGDEVWAVVVNGGRWNSGDYQTTYTNLISQRAAAGFTVIYTEALATTFIGAANNGQMWDGAVPFTSGGDPTTGLNNTYWQRMDYFLSTALSYGITVAFSLGGHWDIDNAGASLNGLTNTQLQAYGNALGTRYASQPNLVWLIMDDYFGSYDSKLDSILTGIRAAGDTHLITIENYSETSSRFDLSNSASTTWGAANAQFNFGYSYDCTYLCVEYMFAEASPLTPVYGDGYFYQGGSSYSSTFDRAMRQDAWWALTSGARGWQIGDEGEWQWTATAANQAATAWFANNNAGAIRTFMESLPGWYNLAPALGAALITAGRGTRATQFTSGGGGGQYEIAFTNTYVSASITADGTLAAMYLPAATTITVDTTKFAAGWTASWVDPVSCATTSAGAGPTFNSTAKGSNSQGDPDWVLVFQSPPVTSGTGAWFPGRSPKARLRFYHGSWRQQVQQVFPALPVNASVTAGYAVATARAAPGPVFTGLLALSVPAVGTGQVTALPAAALATGTAFQPVAAVTALPAAALATGTASQPVAAVTALPAAALATGTASQPTVQVAAAPATALATGTAAQPAISYTAGAAAATGVAYQPVVQVTAAAGLASGTGSAQSPPARVTAFDQTGALAAGTASNPVAQVTAFDQSGALAAGTASNPVAQVTAFDQSGPLAIAMALDIPPASQPVVVTLPQRGRMIPGRHLLRRQQAQLTFSSAEIDVSLTAGAALATGTAAQVIAQVTGTDQTGGLATGAAQQAVAQVTALPAAALATAVASSPAPGWIPAAALATGAAAQAVAQVTGLPAAALATGTANNPSVTAGGDANVAAAVALATGTAFPPTAQVTALPATALATGTASGPASGRIAALASATGTASGSAPGWVPALASATGAAFSPAPGWVPAAAPAAGAAQQAVARVTVLLGAALATAAAYNPAVTTGGDANVAAAAAFATGTAAQPAAQVTVLPAAALATGAASLPGTGRTPAAGFAPGTASAPVVQLTAGPASALAAGAAQQAAAGITAFAGFAVATGAGQAAAAGRMPAAALATGIVPAGSYGGITFTAGLAAGTGTAANVVVGLAATVVRGTSTSTSVNQTAGMSGAVSQPMGTAPSAVTNPASSSGGVS